MSTREPFVRRLWRKFFPEKPAAKPATASGANAKKAAQAPVRPTRRSSIESLEGRIAPATLLPGGKGISYTDSDGDLVTVTFSKALFTGPNDVVDVKLASVFKFDTGKAHTGASDPTNDAPQQLQLIDLTVLSNTIGGLSPADGVSITVTAQAAGGGDGLVNVGAIKAPTISLGNVTIHGDLGQIDAGRDSAVVGVKSLNVDTLGKLTNTQSGVADYESRITGTLGSFTAREVDGAYLHVIDGSITSGHPAVAHGNIGSITIASHLQPRDLTSTTSSAGFIQASGNIASISIGSGARPDGLPADGLVGGGGALTGSILAGGTIKSVTINGDLTGGSGQNSGSIYGVKGLGTVHVTGSLVGGSDDSGSIFAGQNPTASSPSLSPSVSTAAITVDGKLIGGGGTSSGAISVGSNLGSLKVKGALLGGNGDESGRVLVGGNLKTLVVGSGQRPSGETGDGLIGGVGVDSGTIIVGNNLTSALIDGDMTGGTGINGGVVSVGKNLTSIEVRGLISGGDGDNSGSIGVAGNIGTVKITHTVAGAPPSGITAGAGDSSGFVYALGSISSVTVVGDITGIEELPGTGSGTGTSTNAGGIFAGGVLKNLTVQGSIIGGDGDNFSGFVEALGSLGTVKIAGDITGGPQANSGVIVTPGGATSIVVNGSLLGGAGVSSGAIAVGQGGTAKLGNLQIDGGIFGGDGDGSASVSAFTIRTVRISHPSSTAGSAAIQGGDGDGSGSIHSAGGMGTLTIQGTVSGGLGDNSGQVEVHGVLQKLTAGALEGGQGNGSGAVLVKDLIRGARLTAGSLGTGHVGDIVGGRGSQSGALVTDGGIGQITAGNLLLGEGELSGLIRTGMGSTGVGNVGSLKLGSVGVAAMQSDPAVAGGTVQVNGTITQFSASDLLGAEVHAVRISSFTANSVVNSLVTAEGGATAKAKTDVAFGKITVVHDVTNSDFLAGYDFDSAPVNGHAQIGAVSVGGNWIASDLVAGARDASQNGYGNADDVAIQNGDGSSLTSKIASIVIKGSVTGTADPGDHFGLEAHQIGAITVHGQRIALNQGVAELAASTTQDVTARIVS